MRPACVVLAFVAAACGGAAVESPGASTSTTSEGARDANKPATWVLRNGFIHRKNGVPATAIAVRGSKIVAVGLDKDVQALIGPSTKVTDLLGRSVVASLTDAHGHLEVLGGLQADVDLTDCETPVLCAERVRKNALKSPERPWVLGRGWDQNRFEGGQAPTRAEIEEVGGGRPVYLRRSDGRAGWANSKALAVAGINRDTKAPAGGKIVTDKNGDPTGILLDTAMSLVERVIPPLDAAALERAILAGQNLAFASGITCVHEMGVEREAAAAYRKLSADGRLKLRVVGYGSTGGLLRPLDVAGMMKWLDENPDVPNPERRFALRGMKLYADGALGNRGAALLAPYTDDPQNSGRLQTSPQTLERIATRALERNWQLAVHAVGDAANRAVLDAFERAGCQRHSNHRFRIEHAEVVDPADIPRFGRLGIIASMQPAHATSDMAWAEARLGPTRTKTAYAWQRFIAAGVPLALGSDFSVELPDPLRGLFAAITRTTPQGQPPGGWNPQLKISFQDALIGYTSMAAYAGFEESFRGDAAVGQVADLTVFDRKLDGTTPQVLTAGNVDITAINGEIVYERH